MLRILMAAVVAVALVNVSVAADTKKEVTLEGTIACAKCTFKVDGVKTCNIAIKVKDEVILFDKDSSKKFHDDYCTASKEGKVTGTIVEKDGKKFLTVTKLEAK